MATQIDELIESIHHHCRQKPGMRLTTWESRNEYKYNLMGGFLDDFARIMLGEDPPVLMVRCTDSYRENLAITSQSILVSKKMRWDTHGWTWTDVILDGSIPDEMLFSLIDQSYQLVYDSDAVNSDKKHEIDLIVRQLNQQEILEDLISWYDLSDYRSKIKQIAKQTILLKTHAIEESEIPLGQTKIGGAPDLPAEFEWPIHHSGKSLAFLAQINLLEVANVSQIIDLPSDGILYFFSVYGWQNEEGTDPILPNEQPDESWTQILFQPTAKVELYRLTLPSDVNGFKAARVENIPTISLPRYPNKSIVKSLGFNRDESDALTWKLGNLIDSFETVLNYGLGHPANHILLGYGSYDRELFGMKGGYSFQTLFHLSSDYNTEMTWGDDGFLCFLINPRDLKIHNFANVLVEYECG